MNAIFPLFVVWPLATGTLLFLVRKRSALQESLSTLALLVNLIMAVALLSATADGTIFVHRMGLWPFPYAIVLAADRLTATMLCLSSSIVGTCAVFARSYLTDAQRKEAFHPLLHFLLMGIQGCFITGDLFNLFVFFEVMLMATYALLGFYYNLDQLEMAFKYTCLNLIASAFFLLGVSLLYAQVGTVNMADLAEKIKLLGPTPLIVVTALVFVFVFSVKAAIFPMHLWLPSAHSISPTPISAILAGVLVKVGIYSIIRCATLIFPAAFLILQPGLIALCLLTIAMGALGALPQTSLKRILAYSTINQLGYIAFGIALLSQAGLAAAVFYIVGHAYLKSAMLLGAGLNQKLTGTVDLDEMGGMMGKAPFASLLMLVGFLSLAGFPPFAGFFAKLFVLQAGFSQGAILATGIALGFGVISLYYNFTTYQRYAWGTGGGEVGAASAGLYGSFAFLSAFAVRLRPGRLLALRVGATRGRPAHETGVIHRRHAGPRIRGRPDVARHARIHHRHHLDIPARERYARAFLRRADHGGLHHPISQEILLPGQGVFPHRQLFQILEKFHLGVVHREFPGAQNRARAPVVDSPGHHLLQDDVQDAPGRDHAGQLHHLDARHAEHRRV